MIYKLEDASAAAALFSGWPDLCISSCLQGVMGSVFVTDPEHPRSAMAYLGEYAFCAGEPDRELALFTPRVPLIIVPLSGAWDALIGSLRPEARKAVRYATRKDTVFDRERLSAFAAALPAGYELRAIEGALLDRCFAEGRFAPFGTREGFIALGGRGFAVMKDGEPVAFASSYSACREGIEVDVVTAESERRRGLSTCAAAALILSCLDDGLYPSWDAANTTSLHLARKLGYTFSREYTAYELDG